MADPRRWLHLVDATRPLASLNGSPLEAKIVFVHFATFRDAESHLGISHFGIFLALICVTTAKLDCSVIAKKLKIFLKYMALATGLLAPALVAGVIFQMANPDCRTCGSDAAITSWFIASCALGPAFFVSELSKSARLLSFAVGCFAGLISISIIKVLIEAILSGLSQDYLVQNLSWIAESRLYLLALIPLTVASATAWVVARKLSTRSKAE